MALLLTRPPHVSDTFFLPSLYICTISTLPRLLWRLFTTRLIPSKNQSFDASMQTEKFSHVSNLHNSTARLACMVLNRGGLPREVAALYGKFKTVYVLRIPLVIEFGSDHIKRYIHHFSIDLRGSLIDQ